MGRTPGADKRKISVEDLLGALKVPAPACKHGYPASQLFDDGADGTVFKTKEAHEAFNRWMFGQTIMLCEGQPSEYHIGWLKQMNAEKPGQYREYDPGNYCDEAHGGVVYSHDLLHYLSGLEPLD